jgi:hypothetical protein
LLLILELRVCLLKDIVDIASVVPASARVVLGPLSQASPTEAEVAFLAGHVIAPLVLFKLEHFGQGLQLAFNQVIFSESLLSFSFQILTYSQVDGK